MKDKREVNNDKRSKDCIIKGKIQTIKQVATVNLETPNK
jgi:hypothetical protein